MNALNLVKQREELLAMGHLGALIIMSYLWPTKYFM